jgi:hypothetical protein
MVDAEEHRTHARYPLGVPDLDALEEEPDPEPRDHPDDGVEGVHYGSSFRCSFSTRRSHRHLATTPHQRQREDVGETQPGLDPVPIGQEGFIEKRDEILALK